MYSKYKNILSRHILNIPGWRTKRKIVVIESDDWGSIRMPSREVYELFLKKEIRLNNSPFNRFDSLASEGDLSRLFNVLLSVKDKNGNPAVITANTIVANPDFEKIKKTKFQQYYYEPFTETLKRYPNHENAFEYWKTGIELGVFRPQFHGREHLNVKRWLYALQQDIGNVRLAFNYQIFDLSTNLDIGDNSFMEALNYENETELEFQKKSIIEGAKLFEKIFKYKSKTFIAPCYIWSDKLNRTIKKAEINCLQGIWFQSEPIIGKEHRFKKKFHYTGQKNKNGQYYITRNAHFEPSVNHEYDWINDVLSRIEKIFQMRKPAIISSHRMNYIGFIDQENSKRNLIKLKKLLDEIVKRWPDVEFMSSDNLCTLISKT